VLNAIENTTVKDRSNMSNITCAKCPAIWTGEGRCHCSKCHITYGGLTSFDNHRRGNKCAKPESLGLKDNGRGVWVADYDG